MILLGLLPILATAQDFTFELQPEAFPVEIEGWELFQPWAGGLNTTTPECCDLDGDGDLDYLSGGSGDYYYAYFTNIGTETDPDFQYLTHQLDSLRAMDVDLVDMDHDGDQDAVMSGLCYRNLGSSNQYNFAAVADTLYDPAGNQLICPRTAAVDIDADGDYDILAGQMNGTLRFYQNMGSPEIYLFQRGVGNWQNIQVWPDPYHYTDPCFADLDGDGDLDLLVGAGDGTLSYYRNDGTPQNAAMTLVSSSYLNLDVQFDASPELADIDSDGDLDLFVGRSPAGGQDRTPGDVYFFRNEGTTQNPAFQWVTTNYLTWDNGAEARPRLVDIDTDGDPDLFSPIGGRLFFYRNQGSAPSPRFVFETDTFQNIAVFDNEPWFVDLDGDGDYDLLAGESAFPPPGPGLHLYLNQGTPQEPDFVLYSDDLLPGCFNDEIVLSPWTADIDADGDQDLFVSTGRLWYFENVGTSAHFRFELDSNNWQNIGAPNYGLAWGCFWDIDGDLDLDLFINSENYGWFPWEKNLTFYRNTGTAQNAVMVLEDDDLFPELMIWQAAPFLYDMDLDGDGDLFVGDEWGGIRYFENTTGDTAYSPYTKPRPQRVMDLSLSPQPGNPTTAISFQLPYAQEVDLAVYNLLGARVATLASGRMNAGSYSLPWASDGYASGIYFVRLTTPTETLTRKLVILQ